MILKLRTDSVEATREVAAALEPILQSGDLMLLSGDLGGGKTAFVQGLAAAMGITAPVTSPTFTLAHTYDGRRRLHHLDVYRFESPTEVIDLDLPGLLDGTAVVAIEWGERVLEELPRDYLVIRFGVGDAGTPPDTRLLEIETVGSSWTSREAALARALQPFVERS